MWAENYTADSGNGGFADVESLLDEEGNQHKEGGKATDDEIGPMGLIDRKLLPDHLESSLAEGICSIVQLATNHFSDSPDVRDVVDS